MRFFSILIVLGATIVGLLWAAQYDYGPVVINQADEYRLVLRLGVPQPELIIFHWPCDRQADCRWAHTKRKKLARQRAVREPLVSRERADPEPPESTHARRGEETDTGTAGAHWCTRRMCTDRVVAEAVAIRVRSRRLQRGRVECGVGVPAVSR